MHHMAVVVWASHGITWIHLSKDVLGAQTGQGKLHTIPLLTVIAIYAQINREENISFFFFPKLLRVLEEKVCSASCSAWSFLHQGWGDKWARA